MVAACLLGLTYAKVPLNSTIQHASMSPGGNIKLRQTACPVHKLDFSFENTIFKCFTTLTLTLGGS